MRWLIGTLMLACAGTLGAQQSQDERVVRQLIENFPESSKKSTDDLIFVSGALPRPLVGRPAISASDTAMTNAQAEVRKRSNERIKTRVQKVEVAKRGDMAYGFALFDLEFDRPDSIGKKEHVKFEGSQLTVWKKQQGQWVWAAAFMRPNEQGSGKREL
jgi:ketosteroid isomerase-like protein